ncbi:NUDIX hydrolase [Candidatus Bathyarchaeota archaeon]|nr:NUDIX hydrolase [Candidatus Bathyarchaeota archaeon]
MSEFGSLIDSRRIYDGRVIGLRVDRIRLPSGEVFDREVVEHRGAVAMLPLLDDGRLLLIRQYRHPVGKILLEIPAGTLSDGETPEHCARRELVEETGYTADDLEELFSCFLAPGYSSEKIHLFLATRLRKVGGNPEIDEFIRLEPTTLEDAEKMIEKGEILDAKTISAIAYFLLTR